MKKKTIKQLAVAHNHLVRFSEILQSLNDDFNEKELKILKSKTNDLLISYAGFKIRAFKGSTIDE